MLLLRSGDNEFYFYGINVLSVIDLIADLVNLIIRLSYLDSFSYVC